MSLSLDATSLADLVAVAQAKGIHVEVRYCILYCQCNLIRV